MRGTNSGIRSVTATDDTGNGASTRLFSICSQFPLTGHDSVDEGIETDNE